MTLYDLFINNLPLNRAEMLIMLNANFDYHFNDPYDECINDHKTEQFDKHMEHVESYMKGIHFEYDVYKHKLTGLLYRHSTYEELYTENWVHDKWEEVTCTPKVVNFYYPVSVDQSNNIS